MKKIPGIIASSGITHGPIYKYEQPILKIEKYKIKDAEKEIYRYRKAKERVINELHELAKNIEEGTEVFMVQEEFLDDSSYGLLIEERIESEKYNSEWLVSEVSQGLINEFKEIDDDYFAQRALDIQDLSIRLIKALLGFLCRPFEDLFVPSIILANDLTPSDTATLKRDMILGICTETGSSTSHTAIISRSMGIPSLVGLKTVDIPTGTDVIVDAIEGFLIISPEETVLKEYMVREKNFNLKKTAVMSRAVEPAVTRDGETVDVFANIGSITDARLGKEFGAEGVGLLRTEFMFLDRKMIPDEEEQYKWYREIAMVYQGAPVIIRTMDIGGDKNLPALKMPEEQNPFLGQRAIRLALSESNLLLIPQLKAILRVGADCNVKILLPMIARTVEVQQVIIAMEEAMKQLVQERKKFSRVDLGIMVEIPSTAIIVDHFASLVDFFSIGTNDLTQYTLAVDRTNEMVAHIADYFDPAVISLINNVITRAHIHGKPVGMCGYMAGDPLATALLLGMGLDEFSMAPGMIPGIKDRLRQYSRKNLKKLVKNCLAAPNAATIREFCKPFLSAEY